MNKKYTSGQRWMVEGFEEPCFVEVLMNEHGEVKFYKYQDGDEMYKVDKEVFFEHNEEAFYERESRIPANSKQVSNYIRYLDIVEPDKVKEWLPRHIFNAYSKHRDAYISFNCTNSLKLVNALRGKITIGNATIPKEEVSYIRYNDVLEVFTKSNEKFTTNDEIEQYIICSIFCFNF